MRGPPAGGWGPARGTFAQSGAEEGAGQALGAGAVPGEEPGEVVKSPRKVPNRN